MSGDVIEFRYPAMGNVEEIDKAISGAIEAAKTMKKKVQYAAIGCMILSAMEGTDDDGLTYQERAVVSANYLVEQVGAGVKGEGLVKFLVFMCGFKLNPASTKDGFIGVSGAEWVRANLEDAKAKAWFDYAPPNPFKGFNLAEELARVLKQADNAVKLGDADADKAKLITVDRDMLDVMTGLLNGTPVTAEHALQLVDKLIPSGEDKLEDSLKVDGKTVPQQLSA